ncbi:MAG: hypothetical protein R2733_18805 [Acidimicrobiales bacterium]
MHEPSAKRPNTAPVGESTPTQRSWWPRVVTPIVIAALLSPAVRNTDSLPLSTYPMYSGTRSNVSSFVTASGIDREGSRRTLSALAIAESRDRLIAQSFLNDAVRRGDAGRVCEDIANRVNADLAAIEIATERHDTIARLRGEESLLERDVHASCETAS